MNLWRLVGLSLFLVGTLCLVGAPKLSSYAGAQDKDKKAETKDKTDSKDTKTEPKKDDKKDPPKAEEKKKEEPKKEEPKKEEPKKEDVKKDQPKASGDALTFKAFEGKPWYQVQTTKTNQKMIVMNQTVEQKQNQTFVIQWTPKDKDKDGNYQVAQKIVGVKMEIDIGGNKISYDSTQKNPKNPMTDFFEQLTKSELVFTITPDLKVKSVAGRDEFIKGLSDINPQMQSLLRAILSAKALEKMAEPTWWAFPEQGKLGKDQTWKKTSELDLGPIGTYKTTFDFANKGQEGTKDKIGIKTTLEYSAPTEKAGLPFIIHEAKLKSETGEGEAIFDRTKGRFESTKINMKLSGQLKIEVGNMNTNVELNQTQEATSEASDANPWEKKGT